MLKCFNRLYHCVNASTCWVLIGDVDDFLATRLDSAMGVFPVAPLRSSFCRSIDFFRFISNGTLIGFGYLNT
jgi:hypothetical protein